MKRRKITRGEWKSAYVFTKFLLPFLVLMGIVGVVLGNRDGLYGGIVFVLSILLVFRYTRRVKKRKKKKVIGEDGKKKYVTVKGKSKKKKKKKIGKIRILMEIVVVLVGLVILQDMVMYNVAMAQVQIENDGYVTGEVRAGGFEGGMYVVEMDKGKKYKHVFDGWKYLSKVEIKEDPERDDK